MATIMPQGEHVRRAVTWVSEERQASPGARLSKLVEQAAVKFNLSPAESEFLLKFFTEQKG
jgi:hypothetical protein